MNFMQLKQNISKSILYPMMLCGMTSAYGLEPVGLGSHSASGGNITAMATIESYDGQDLNGDGDTSDRILTLHDIDSNIVTNTGVPIVGKLETDGITAVFLYSERVDYVDLNGDSDTQDNVLAYYHIPSGQLHTTQIVPYLSAGQSGSLPHYHVDQNIITFVSKEFFSGVDHNGDSDLNDTVVRYWDTDTNQAYDTPLVSPYAMVDNGVIATRVIENQAIDVNNDGDTDDIVFVSYDITTDQINPFLATPSFNLSNISSFPAKDGDNYYFRARENQLGFDVNGDNNISSTTVIMRLNLGDNSLQWTGIAGTTGRIQARGSYITFDTSEWAINQDINADGNLQNDFLYALHNLSDATTQYFEKTGQVSLGYSVFSRTLYEGSNGDLTGDGDATDVIVYVQALEQSEIIDINNCDVDHIHCRFLSLIDYLQNHTALTDAMKGLLIPLVEDADKALMQGSYNNDMEKYIAVIGSFDVYFDSIWPQDEIADETKIELVEYHPNGRAFKDYLHDLKDLAAAMLEDASQENGNDSGNSQAQSLIAGMAVAIQGSNAPQATKDAMMAEVIWIITIAQQIMAGGNASTLIGDLMNHIQTMRDMLADSINGFSVADIDGISAAIDSFEAFISSN